jgi:hypothetical protein
MHHKYKGRPDLSDAHYMAHFKSRCTITATGCWEWQGFCQTFRNIRPGQRGYALGCYRGKQTRLSRLMIELTQRPLQRGEIAMHSCDNPPCINPDHLRPGTYKENMQDASRKGRADGQWKTHCKRGHEFKEGSFRRYPSTGRRACLICARIRQRLKTGWTEAEACASPDPIPPTASRPRRFAKAA